jgi:hypothetical protein
MANAQTGLDQIEFRRSDAEYGYFCGHGSAPSVEVVINGVELTGLWDLEDDSGVLALAAEDAGADLAIWGPYPPSPGPVAQVPHGFVPVVTCSCGIFGCGGGFARVTFRVDTVMWNDFHSATRRRVIAIGAFTFDREQYETARLMSLLTDE